MKKAPELLTKEEMDRLMSVVSSNLFYNTLFTLAKVTGRRLGEFYGVADKEEVGEKETGKFKTVYTEEGNQMKVPIKHKVYKISNNYRYGLKVKDFIFNDDGTSIMRTWVLKRKVFVQDDSTIPPEVTQLVKVFIRKYKLTLDDYMFRQKTYRTIQHAVTSYAKRANIDKNVSFHSFRHYFITHLLKKGWSHDKIAKITGHKSIQSISSYDHVISSDLKDKVLEDLNGL